MRISRISAVRSKNVLVFGVFDLLHPGHHSFLRQAKKLGHHLTVVVARDTIVKRLKGRKPLHSEIQRQKAVAALPYVDRVRLASKDPSRRFSFIKNLRPHIIALGYDQSHYTENLQAELRKRGIRATVIRLRPHRPKHYKSSILRRRVRRSKSGGGLARRRRS